MSLSMSELEIETSGTSGWVRARAWWLGISGYGGGGGSKLILLYCTINMIARQTIDRGHTARGPRWTVICNLSTLTVDKIMPHSNILIKWLWLSGGALSHPWVRDHEQLTKKIHKASSITSRDKVLPQRHAVYPYTWSLPVKPFVLCLWRVN